jgi:hypothetical protein
MIEEQGETAILFWWLRTELLREMLALHMARQPKGADDMEVQLPDEATIKTHAEQALADLYKHIAVLGVVPA